ncbi:MAG: RNA polymerase sigma factor [Planctomycetota bacterium]|jgi:RNA polymerase sigma-70 factor (ECF subfamily)
MNTATWTMADWIISARAPERARVKDDHALVEGFLARGEEDCFDRLVEKYKDRVFRLAVSVMGPESTAEAEDVTQEVFIQVYRKLSTFRKESGFSTWLYRITYNQALERRRRARFRLPHQGEEVLASMEAPVEETDPVTAAVKRQRKRIVLEALEGLDEPHRTAIHLYYWMKCSVAEIAEHLGTRPGTVKSYLYRGRERLAKILKKEQEDG